MAENPIRKEDIIDIEGVNTGLKELIKLLNIVLSSMESIKKQADDTTVSLSKLNPANKEEQKEIAAKVETLQELKVQYTELEKIKQKIEKASTEEYKEEVRARQALQEKTKAVKDQVKAEGSAIGSITRMRLELANLKKAYYDADKATREKLKPAIQQLTDTVTKAEKAIGVHSRGVGNYKNAVMSAGKELLGFLGVAGAGVTVMNKLKEAFAGTEAGANFFKRTTTGISAFFESLVTNTGGGAGITGRLSDAFSSAKEASKVADLMDRVRIGDRKDLVEIAKLERDLVVLRWEANDATRGEAAQLASLNLAMVKEDDLLNYKIADKQEELDLVNQMLAILPLNTKLLETQAQLEADIIDIEGSRNLRLISRQSALTEKLKEKDIKAIADKMAANKKANDKLEEMGISEITFAQSKSAQLVDIKLQEIKKTQDADIANAEFQKELAREVREEKINNFVFEAERYISIASDINNSFADILQRRKEKELSMVGDNAEAREKIEKEYAKKEKAMQITAAIISTAGGIARALKDYPFPMSAVIGGIVGALGAVQIGIIGSQKFAEGGYTGDGSGRDETGERVAGVVHEREYVIPKEPTRKYRSLLEAIHNDNPMAIAEELRGRKFHQVWGGVQPKLEMAQRQDPYTMLMYNLMKNSVTTYEDSNGDTVLRFADGSTRVIKK